MIRKMLSTILIISLLLLSGVTSASDVTLQWQYPVQYCNGDALPLTDIMTAEIYISESTIPRVPTNCGTEADVPPVGTIIQQVTTPDTSVIIDLPCGEQYFFVMRIQVLTAEWSNFSGETTHDLECGRPGIPIIISIT